MLPKIERRFCGVGGAFPPSIMPSLSFLDNIDFPSHGKLNDLVRVYFVELFKTSKTKARAEMFQALQRVDTFEQWVLTNIIDLYGLGPQMGCAVRNSIDFAGVRDEIVNKVVLNDSEMSDDESETA